MTTDSSQEYDVAILLAPEDGQCRLDDVDRPEEVCLELVLYQSQGPRALAQLFHSAHDHFRMTAEQDVNPAKALHSFSDGRLTLAHDAHVQCDDSQSSAPCLLVLMCAHLF